MMVLSHFSNLPFTSQMHQILEAQPLVLEKKTDNYRYKCNEKRTARNLKFGYIIA